MGGGTCAVSMATQDSPSNAAEDYARGWYLCQPERIGARLHPQLVKRTQHSDGTIQELSKDVLVQLTREKKTICPEDRQTCKVAVCAQYEGFAMVQLEMEEWYDYMQLVKEPGEGTWLILNVLWHPK